MLLREVELKTTFKELNEFGLTKENVFLNVLMQIWRTQIHMKLVKLVVPPRELYKR